MREVLKALKFLHDRSIAHLDLKPQNILLAGDRVEGELSFGIRLRSQLISILLCRWTEAVRLWDLAGGLRGHQRAGNGWHPRLRGPRGAPVRAALPADGHLVGGRPHLRTALGFFALWRRHQAGDLPQHLAVRPHLSGQSLRRRLAGGHRLYPSRIAN